MDRVYFAIPVSAKLGDEQWSRLNELLKLTLDSVLNQSDGRYTAFVCGHDKPPILEEPRYEGVEFIRLIHPPPQTDQERRRDKRRKRWEIARRVRELGGGYYMYLDGDDAIHKDLVAYVLGDNNKIGYLIDRGYALDFANRVMAAIPGAFKKDFNDVCGSSGVVYMLPEDLPSGEFGDADESILYMRIRNHKSFETEPMRQGGKLKAVPFPAGVYTLNNSINLSNILVRTEERQVSLVEGIKKHEIASYDGVAECFALETFLNRRG